MMQWIRRMALTLATGFGLGLSPVASGTAGTLPGILIVMAIWPYGLFWQILAAVILPILAIPICEIAERHFVEKDDGRIVADEYLTFPICMLGLYDKWQDLWWLMPMCFVVSRVMDIVKPFPAYRLQKLPSGLGITIDDVVASLYALGANWALYLAIQGT